MVRSDKLAKKSSPRDSCRQSLGLRRDPNRHSEAISVLRAFCRDLRNAGNARAVPQCCHFVEKRYLMLHNVRSGANMRARYEHDHDHGPNIKDRFDAEQCVNTGTAAIIFDSTQAIHPWPLLVKYH